MKEPLTSIILPTYNGALWIESAIQSIINQSYVNWELLIIDDGSNDNTGNIVNNFAQKDTRIRYIKNESNMGIQKALNRGLNESKGEYIARIDDDDIWVDNDKLKKQIEFLEKNNEYVLVGTGVIVINESGSEMFRYLVPTSDEAIRNKILGKNCFVHSSVVFKKGIVMKFGGYSESIEEKHFEDYDLWLKLGTVGKFANLPIYSVKYTMRKNSLSSKNRTEVFQKLISHIKKYRHSYRNYYAVLVRAYARFILYSIYMTLPVKFSLNKITKFYKEF